MKLRNTKLRLGFLITAVLLFLTPTISLQASRSINKNDKLMLKFMQGKALPKPEFTLFDPGSDAPLDYVRYGEFQGVGTDKYHFTIKNIEALKKDIGTGIYPNEDGVYKDPAYKQMRKAGLLKGRHWDFIKSGDSQRNFFVWAHAPEDSGVKAFFTAVILDNAGLIVPALKAYYAALVHFPRSASWAADGSFVWYIAPSAIASIQRLCSEYPTLECELTGANFDIINGGDTNLSNDIIKVNPGKIIRKTLKQKLAKLADMSRLKVVEARGNGKVQLVRFSNGHWQMRVDGKPFMVRAVSYMPTEIGLTPHTDPNATDYFMFKDKNQSGIIDAPYEAWVDKNGNSAQDPDEPAVGDFQLMKDMGVNAIRWFAPNRPSNMYDPSLVNKPLLRDLFDRFGIRVLVYDLLGAYTVGSGANWDKGTDYTDAQQRTSMKEAVRQKVIDLKDEPFVLMWVLGNENNMPGNFLGVNATRTNAGAHPEVYARFINEVAEMIHELDPDHPVAIGNLELGLGEYYRKFAPAIDIWGINSYRGEHGFGLLFHDAKKIFNRPILVSEYGCDAYADKKGVDEEAQSRYHLVNVRQIVLNQAGGPMTGNAIGGILFEYVDEWWKAPDDPPDQQTTRSQGTFSAPDGQAHEEWFGIASQGSSQNSPFERRLRKAYFMYKDIWNHE